MGSLGGESDQPKSSAQVVKIRFRLHDGTDVGPVDLSLGATVAEVKSAALAAWPTVRWATSVGPKCGCCLGGTPACAVPCPPAAPAVRLS